MNRIAGHRLEIDDGAGGDLTGQHHQTGGAQGLGGDARVLVLRQDGIEHAVGNLVRDLVRVPFRDGFEVNRKLLLLIERRSF